MITKDTKAIMVEAYQDGGKPCCAKSFEDGEVCPFYRGKKYGTFEFCVMDNQERRLERRGDRGTGTLIPNSGCVVWGKEELNNT